MLFCRSESTYLYEKEKDSVEQPEDAVLIPPSGLGVADSYTRDVRPL